MAFSVVMPALEMAQETGKLLAWRKKEGDRVSKGEPLLEIETDKAVVEVEAPADGILAGIKASEGADIGSGRPSLGLSLLVKFLPQTPSRKLQRQGLDPTPRLNTLRRSRKTPRLLHHLKARPQRSLPRPAVSPRNCGSTLQPCVEPVPVERFLPPMCRPRPPRHQRRVRLRSSKCPLRLDASWPSALRK